MILLIIFITIALFHGVVFEIYDNREFCVFPKHKWIQRITRALFVVMCVLAFFVPTMPAKGWEFNWGLAFLFQTVLNFLLWFVVVWVGIGVAWLIRWIWK